MLLRIDDLDPRRCTREFEMAAVEDLRWLGVEWDGDPVRQSDRMQAYRDSIDALRDRGLLFASTRGSTDVEEAVAAPHGPVFVSPSMAALEERNDPAAGSPAAWRLSVEVAAAQLGDGYESLSYVEETADGLVSIPAEPWRFADVVIARSATASTYHLSCVLDDAAQGVTHVMRGDELREAAGLHALLARLLDLPPVVYRHHRMITDQRGQRFSKRDNAHSLRAMRAAGLTPQALKKRLSG